MIVLLICSPKGMLQIEKTVCIRIASAGKNNIAHHFRISYNLLFRKLFFSMLTSLSIIKATLNKFEPPVHVFDLLFDNRDFLRE